MISQKFFYRLLLVIIVNIFSFIEGMSDAIVVGNSLRDLVRNASQRNDDKEIFIKEIIRRGYNSRSFLTDAMFLAIQEGYQKGTEALIAMGADIYAVDSLGKNVLHYGAADDQIMALLVPRMKNAVDHEQIRALLVPGMEDVVENDPVNDERMQDFFWQRRGGNPIGLNKALSWIAGAVGGCAVAYALWNQPYVNSTGSTGVAVNRPLACYGDGQVAPLFVGYARVRLEEEKNSLNNRNSDALKNLSTSLLESSESGQIFPLPHGYTTSVVPFCVVKPSETIDFIKGLGLDVNLWWDDALKRANSSDLDKILFMSKEADKMAHKINSLGSLLERMCQLRLNQTASYSLLRRLKSIISPFTSDDQDNEETASIGHALSSITSLSFDECAYIVNKIVRHGGGFVRAFEGVIRDIKSRNLVLIFDEEKDSYDDLDKCDLKSNSCMPPSYTYLQPSLPAVMKHFFTLLANKIRTQVLHSKGRKPIFSMGEIIIRAVLPPINQKSSVKLLSNTLLSKDEQDVVHAFLEHLENQVNAAVIVELAVNDESKQLQVYRIFVNHAAAKHPPVLGNEVHASSSVLHGRRYVRLESTIASFHEAVLAGNLQAVRFFNTPENGSLKLEQKMEAFLLAMLEGHQDLVSLFLQDKEFIAEMMQNSQASRKVCFVAVVMGYVDVVNQLVKAYPEVLKKNLLNDFLFFAAITGQKKVIEDLLTKGVNINYKGSMNETALSSAIISCRKDVVQLLLNRGANARGTPSLVAAVICGDKDLVELLLLHGADINECDENGATPLHLAAALGKKELVELLLSRGANVNFLDKNNATPLHAAAFMYQNFVMELILSLNTRKISRMSAREIARNSINNSLFVKIMKNESEQYLEKALIELNARNYMEIIKLLVVRGADVSQSDKDGNTALHFAVSGKSFIYKSFIDMLNRATDANVEAFYEQASHQVAKDIIEVLLSLGSSVNAVNKDGKTPLDFAQSSGFEDLAPILTFHGGKSFYQRPCLSNAAFLGVGIGIIALTAVLIKYCCCNNPFLVIEEDDGDERPQGGLHENNKHPFVVAVENRDREGITRILKQDKDLLCAFNSRNLDEIERITGWRPPEGFRNNFQNNQQGPAEDSVAEARFPNDNNYNQAENPLLAAFRNNNVLMIKELLIKMSPQDLAAVRDVDGNTILHMAAKLGNKEISNLLFRIMGFSQSDQNNLDRVTEEFQADNRPGEVVARRVRNLPRRTRPHGVPAKRRDQNNGNNSNIDIIDGVSWTGVELPSSGVGGQAQGQILANAAAERASMMNGSRFDQEDNNNNNNNNEMARIAPAATANADPAFAYGFRGHNLRGKHGSEGHSSRGNRGGGGGMSRK